MRAQVGEMELKKKDETAENEQKLKRCEGDLQSWHGQKKKKCDMWFKTIDLNAPAKLGIDFCWCGESKMFVLFHKPISCKETPFPVCLLTHSLWLQLYCRGGAL